MRREPRWGLEASKEASNSFAYDDSSVTAIFLRVEV
jgi:hypothetical protein